MEELLGSLLELLAYAIVAVGLTLVGLFAELTSLSYFVGGNVLFGIWLALMGAIALYAGIVALGVEEVLPRLRETLELV